MPVRRAAAGLAVGLLAFPGEGPVLENVRALKTTFERGQDLGARVRRATGATDRVAVNDYPFAVAYLTGRPTVALDGSMNGVGFVRDYLARQREAEFVRSRADYVLVLVKAGAVASAASDGRGRSWTYALGQPGPFRKAIGVSQFSFGEEQVVFRLGSSWEGYDDVWLVRVASDTRR